MDPFRLIHPEGQTEEMVMKGTFGIFWVLLDRDIIKHNPIFFSQPEHVLSARNLLERDSE